MATSRQDPDTSSAKTMLVSLLGVSETILQTLIQYLACVNSKSYATNGGIALGELLQDVHKNRRLKIGVLKNKENHIKIFDCPGNCVPESCKSEIRYFIEVSHLDASLLLALILKVPDLLPKGNINNIYEAIRLHVEKIEQLRNLAIHTSPDGCNLMFRGDQSFLPNEYHSWEDMWQKFKGHVVGLSDILLGEIFVDDKFKKAIEGKIALIEFKKDEIERILQYRSVTREIYSADCYYNSVFTQKFSLSLYFEKFGTLGSCCIPFGNRKLLPPALKDCLSEEMLRIRQLVKEDAEAYLQLSIPNYQRENFRINIEGSQYVKGSRTIDVRVLIHSNNGEIPEQFLNSDSDESFQLKNTIKEAFEQKISEKWKTEVKIRNTQYCYGSLHMTFSSSFQNDIQEEDLDKLLTVLKKHVNSPLSQVQTFLCNSKFPEYRISLDYDQECLRKPCLKFILKVYLIKVNNIRQVLQQMKGLKDHLQRKNTDDWLDQVHDTYEAIFKEKTKDEPIFKEKTKDEPIFKEKTKDEQILKEIMVKVFKHKAIKLQKCFVGFIIARKRVQRVLLAIADDLENRLRNKKIGMVTGGLATCLGVAGFISDSFSFGVVFSLYFAGAAIAGYSEISGTMVDSIALSHAHSCLYKEKHVTTLLEKELKFQLNKKTMTFAGKEEATTIRSSASDVTHSLKLKSPATNKADDVTDTDFRSLPYIETAFQIIGYTVFVKLLPDDINSIFTNLNAIHYNEIPKKVRYLREVAAQINVPDEKEFIKKFRILRGQSAN